MNLALYAIRRLFAILPTLLGVSLISFVIINLAPGSPIEQKIQQIRFGSLMSGGPSAGISGSSSRSQQGVSQEIIDALKKQYGFDRPVLERYWIWLKNLAKLDFGKSFTYEEPVMKVILQKMPVSLQFGLVSFLLSYLICIPLGVAKAVRQGHWIDTVSSGALFLAYSTPPFMLAILLIVFLGGGSFLDWFPISGAVSDHYEKLSFWGKAGDRAYHMALPLLCYLIGQFTALTILMKNSLLEEIRKDYVRTARAKGLGEKKILFRHVLRNALIPVVTGLGSFLSVFFAGSLLIETIFSLDGMGLLGYSSILARDYNVIMGLVVMESLLYLLGNVISDVAYVWVDPRVDFSAL